VIAVVFKDEKILMVKEKAGGVWSLPGGWGDIGLTPSEVAVNEVKEESGFDVKAVKLLGVLDKKCHPHPPSPYHVYKIFILCEIVVERLRLGLKQMPWNFLRKMICLHCPSGEIQSHKLNWHLNICIILRNLFILIK